MCQRRNEFDRRRGAEFSLAKNTNPLFVLDKHLASITTQWSFFIENNKKGVTAKPRNT